jgi:glycosyltransferase involved in cell wall biosynthesis
MTVTPQIEQPAPVSTIVMTYNEEKNLDACLKSLEGWVDEIIVVDSFSTDSTLEIARQYTDRIHQNAYLSAPAQWAWALGEIEVRHEWLLTMDADFRITSRLRDSIIAAVRENDPSVGSYAFARLQVFRGKALKHGGLYPRWEVRLVRRTYARVDETQGVDHQIQAPGLVKRLKGDLIENNENEDLITNWLQKHDSYSTRQAQQEYAWRQAAKTAVDRPALWGSPRQRKRWLKQRWYGMPLYLRPLLYFMYRYILRLGFLDGKQGFLYHFLQAYWYRLVVDIKLEELLQGSSPLDTQSRDQ